MKKILLIFFLALSVLNLSAQDDNFQTVFHAPLKISGMGGPFMIFTSINGQFAHLLGGGGGIIIDDFVLGGFGYGTTNHLRPPEFQDYRNLRMDYGFGGFLAGYTFMATRAVHPVVYLSAGWGQINLNELEDISYMRDNTFILIPQAEVEFNFTHFFKVGLGACYMITSGVDLQNSANSDFSGPGASLSFRFGKF